MSEGFERTRALLRSIDYDPRRLRSNSVDMILDRSVLSRDASVFLELWTRRDHPYLSLHDLYSRTWSEADVLAHYRELSDEDKATVLAIATFPLHEITHHFDLLLTPYGANLHGKIFREYYLMESEVAQCLDIFLDRVMSRPSRSHLTLRRLFRLLVDDPSYIRDQFTEDERALLERVHERTKFSLAYFEFFSNHAETSVKPGWGDGESTKTLSVLGKRFCLLTVNGWFHTISSDEGGGVLTPQAILEARAMANALAWIVHNFPQENEGVCESKRFLESFYAPTAVSPEYHLLLDLFASAVSREKQTFIELLANLTRDQLLKLTGTISTCCWYALFAMPPTASNSLAMCSPVYRLLRALRQIETDAGNGVKASATTEATVAAYYQRIDASTADLLDPHQICKESTEWLEEYMKINAEKTQHPVFRGHFGKVLEAIRSRLAAQQDYGIPPGLVTAGRPFIGPGMIEFDDPSFIENYLLDYRSPVEIEKWSVLREEIFYRARWRFIRGQFQEFFLAQEGTVLCPRCSTFGVYRFSHLTRPLNLICPVCKFSSEVSCFGSDVS